jgi:hypothetical protein
MNVGGLANYIAFRLANEQKQNWWGAATNLQTLNFSPFEFCREMLLENCDLQKLNEFERDLIIKAII